MFVLGFSVGKGRIFSNVYDDCVFVVVLVAIYFDFELKL